LKNNKTDQKNKTALYCYYIKTQPMERLLKHKIIPAKVSKKEAGDTGMAVVLVLLIIGFFTQNDLYYKLAIPFLVIDMAFPMFYYPFAFVWLGFTNLLGTVVSSVLLTVIYFLVVLPMGLFRRMLGKDNLNLDKFRKSQKSVLKTRDIDFSAEDIANPY